MKFRERSLKEILFHTYSMIDCICYFLYLGAFGIDFSSHDNVNEGVSIVSKGLFQYGVTSFLPTLVSSHAEVYHRV